jgi:PAS domain S-box-containing protein
MLVPPAPGRDSSPYFALLVQRQTSPAAMLTLDGVILACNAHLAKLLNSTEAEIEGRPFDQFLAVPYGSSFRRLVQRELPSSLAVAFCETGAVRPVAQLFLRRISGPAPGLLLVAVPSVPRVVAQIQQQQEELEVVVAERTVELAEANARLQEELAERQRAERERSESERRYQALMEAAPDPILIHAAGACVFANRQAAMLLGASSPEALLDRPILELIHHDDRPAALERIAQAYAGAHTPRRDFRYLRLDGTTVEVEVSGTRVEFGGQPAVLIFIRDITERKRAEAALRQSQADLNRAQAVAHTGSWRIDVAGQRLLWSDETYRIFGIPPGTPLTYETFLAAVHPDDRGAVDTAWQAALDGEPYDLEHRILAAGEVRWVGERAELERDRDGTLRGGFGTVQDITERKRAEDALAASQHLLHSVLEQAAEGITVRDAQGRVMFVNAVARRAALRRPEGTALASAPEVWGDYLDADGKPVPLEQWPSARALRGETVSGEFLRRTPAGPMFVLNSAAPVRNEKGEIIGVVTIITDISERKRMEDRLRDALTQEQRALADNVTLLREVHHRTKNNLQMLCDLLFLKAETLPSGEPRALLEDSYGRIYAFARLHEQLYETMQGGAVRLGEYLERLVESVRQFAVGPTIRMEVAPGDHRLDLDRAISAGLIVNELLTNAIKHAFPKGQPGAMGVRLQVQGGDYALDVWDTGRGLPPDLDAEKTQSLGLRLVHLLARRLQASVRLKNDGGATFTVQFPMQGH